MNKVGSYVDCSILCDLLSFYKNKVSFYDFLSPFYDYLSLFYVSFTELALLLCA
jgi:hypothetical protein